MARACEITEQNRTELSFPCRKRARACEITEQNRTELSFPCRKRARASASDARLTAMLSAQVGWLLDYKTAKQGSGLLHVRVYHIPEKEIEMKLQTIAGIKARIAESKGKHMGVSGDLKG